MSWINSPFIKSNIYFNDLNIFNNKVEASCKICRKILIIAGISSSSNLRRHYKTVQCTLYSRPVRSIQFLILQVKYNNIYILV